jgi:hypothetical protein
MWYDKYQRTPTRGSPMETLLCLVRVGRTHGELRGIRALVQVNMPAGKDADPAIAAFKEYHDEMLPFLAKAANAEVEEARAHLENFVKGHAVIDLKPVYEEKLAKATRAARMRGRAIPRKEEVNDPLSSRQSSGWIGRRQSSK